ncbi:RidA family protein [Nonomuraea thailandensis]
MAWDENGELVAPGDLAGQVAQVYRNVAKALDAAGATFHDVVRFTWYAAGWKRRCTTPSMRASSRRRASSTSPRRLPR